MITFNNESDFERCLVHCWVGLDKWQRVWAMYGLFVAIQLLVPSNDVDYSDWYNTSERLDDIRFLFSLAISIH